MGNKKRRYSPGGFRRQAAERVETSGLSIMDVAAELGFHETQLRRWIRQFCRSGTGSARRPATQAQSSSLANLAAENARLKREFRRDQTERDILEKAALTFGAATRRVSGSWVSIVIPGPCAPTVPCSKSSPADTMLGGDDRRANAAWRTGPFSTISAVAMRKAVDATESRATKPCLARCRQARRTARRMPRTVRGTVYPTSVSPV